MTRFSVLLVTVPPPGSGGEAGGAFLKIDGRESLLRSAELFLNRDNVVQVQIVFTPEAMEEAKRKYAPHLSFSGVKILQGGPKWMDQLAAAMGKIAEDSTNVIIHDAARPAVPYNDLEAVMEAAEKHDVVALCAPARSALVEVDEGGAALAVSPASRFLHLSTPQAFSKARFEQMIGERQEPHPSSLHLVKGSSLNVRAGGWADAGFMKAMIHMLPKPKIKGPLTPFDEAQW